MILGAEREQSQSSRFCQNCGEKVPKQLDTARKMQDFKEVDAVKKPQRKWFDSAASEMQDEILKRTSQNNNEEWQLALKKAKLYYH